MSTFELSSFDEPSFRRELLVVASFLAGYGTSTRTGYATDLRLFAEWCRANGLDTPLMSLATDDSLIPASSNSFSRRWISRARCRVTVVRVRVRSRS